MFLIDVTVKEIDFDLTGPDDLPMAEFTVEVGTPTLALKGTFSEYLIPDPSGHNSPEVKGRWNTEGNLTTCGDGTGFNSFIKACEQQLTESWVHAHGIDFRDAILNELELALHHPQCDERTGSGGGSCICHRLPGGHALTPEPEPETLMSIWRGPEMWYISDGPCSKLEAMTALVKKVADGDVDIPGFNQSLSPQGLIDETDRGYPVYTFNTINLTLCKNPKPTQEVPFDPRERWDEYTEEDEVCQYFIY